MRHKLKFNFLCTSVSLIVRKKNQSQSLPSYSWFIQGRLAWLKLLWQRNNNNGCQLTHFVCTRHNEVSAASSPIRYASCTVQPGRQMTFQLIMFNLFVHSREMFSSLTVAGCQLVYFFRL